MDRGPLDQEAQGAGWDAAGDHGQVHHVQPDLVTWYSAWTWGGLWSL